jgi:hypothetical protein
VACFNVSQSGAPDVETRTGTVAKCRDDRLTLIENSHAPGGAYSPIRSKKKRSSDAESGGGPSRTMT